MFTDPQDGIYIMTSFTEYSGPSSRNGPPAVGVYGALCVSHRGMQTVSTFLPDQSFELACFKGQWCANAAGDTIYYSMRDLPEPDGSYGVSIYTLQH